ncbi:MAG: hypothetical protein LOD90_00555 [Symbiobacteriaceae bacterium]
MKVDLTKTRYMVEALRPNGQRLPLSGDVLLGLNWEELANEIAGRITAVARQVKIGGVYLHKLLPNGTPLRVLADWGQGWRRVAEGRIYRWQYEQDGRGTITVTAYDPLFALLQSKDDRYYKAGTTAEAILRDLFGSWKVPVGTIQDLRVRLAKRVVRGQRLGDVIAEVLDEARKRGAGKRHIRWADGKVHVLRYGTNSQVWHITQDTIALHTTDEQDIEELVTRVRVFGKEPKEGRAPVIATLSGRTEFGVLQEVVYSDSYDSPAAAKKAAQEILAERGKPRTHQVVEAVDMPWLRRGDRVYIAAGSLVGYYHVLGISHDADAQRMTLEVEPA